MDTKVNYAAVGLFVIILSMAMVAAGLWFGADLSGREYKRYSIYSSEAVTGLNTSAPVRYRGVDVGRVREISLDRKRPDRVHLVVEIATDTPLRIDTRARLSSQGLTGIANVELTGGSPEMSEPEHPEGEPYPVIPTAPSLMSRLDMALDDGLASLERISTQMEKLLMDDNLENIRGTLANVEELTRSLAKHSERLDSVMLSAEGFMADGGKLTSELTRQLPDLFNRMDSALLSVNRMTDSLADSGNEIGTASREGAESLQAITRTTLPQLSSLLRELESLSIGIGALTEELSENPSLLLYGRPRRAPGPGED